MRRLGSVPRVSDGKPDALVLGAGVCGLTSAIRLAEAGLRVTIQAAGLPGQSTSVAAGAIWGPHLCEQSERVDRWAAESLCILLDQVSEPGTGVSVVRGIEAARSVAEPAGWATTLPGFRLCASSELPEGFVTGWQYRAPVVTMPVYLAYLLDRFTASGGQVRVAEVGSLAEVAGAAPVVVNCTGAAAHHLVPDPAVRPIRGQALIVTNPGLTDFFIGPVPDGSRFAYMFPHGGTVLLGGTEQDGDWNTEADPQTARDILAACVAVEPRLAGAEVREHRVGLRPFRPEIRLEAEPAGSGGLMVHNYGHGGAGVTLAWGCAASVTGLVLGATAGLT
jgi:D-amino-acid oxidase